MDASHDNVRQARQRGVKRAVFNKPSGLGLHEMGMKEKTFAALRNFRAGVEGNISELKRVLVWIEPGGKVRKALTPTFGLRY